MVDPSASFSHGWRGVLIRRGLLEKYLGWAIGDGETAQMWRDVWLSSTAKECPMDPNPEMSTNLKVADLFKEHSKEWDNNLIETLFPLLMESIMSINPSVWGGEDARIWLKKTFGPYSAKPCYFAALEHKQSNDQVPHSITHDWVQDVWKVPMAPKLKLFIWKAKRGTPPIGENLAIRQIVSSPKCIHCDESESLLHLFFTCLFAKQVWELLPVSEGIQGLPPTSFHAGWKAI